MSKNSVLIGLAGLVFIATPFVASADTVSDLQAQIASLQTQIKTLEIQLKAATMVSSPETATSSSTSVVASVCPNISRSLSLGVRGDDVMQLQHFLSVHGLLNASSTGYFGPLTKSAVGKWQAENSIATPTTAGFGVFGPLSRSHFGRMCLGDTQGHGNQNSDKLGFSAHPDSGTAPLTVQFSSSARSGESVGTSVNFGDGSSGTLAFVPVCSNCNALATVSHTYTSAGVFTATLMRDSCPPGAECFVGPLPVATTTITVSASSTSSANIQKVNAPATVTLSVGTIAEVRNLHIYFTLQRVTATTATIQPTAVGCWNSFPSDPVPHIRCMIAVMPIAPQTLSVGQSYAPANYTVTLTSIENGSAMFSVSSSTTSH